MFLDFMKGKPAIWCTDQPNSAAALSYDMLDSERLSK